MRSNAVAVRDVLECYKYGFALLCERKSGSGALLERLDSLGEFVLVFCFSSLINLIVAVAAPTVQKKCRVTNLRIEKSGRQRKTL
jgi:hypothetical protein